jgi:hypothetical protein
VTSALNHDSTGPVSLDERIRQTERQLAGRQSSIGVRAAALGRSVRENLSSPIALLVAAGAGFAIGQYSKRKKAEPTAESEPSSVRPSIFATLMDAITLATTVLAMFPAMRREPPGEAGAAGEMP